MLKLRTGKHPFWWPESRIMWANAGHIMLSFLTHRTGRNFFNVIRMFRILFPVIRYYENRHESLLYETTVADTSQITWFFFKNKPVFVFETTCHWNDKRNLRFIVLTHDTAYCRRNVKNGFNFEFYYDITFLFTSFHIQGSRKRWYWNS